MDFRSAFFAFFIVFSSLSSPSVFSFFLLPLLLLLRMGSRVGLPAWGPLPKLPLDLSNPSGRGRKENGSDPFFKSASPFRASPPEEGRRPRCTEDNQPECRRVSQGRSKIMAKHMDKAAKRPKGRKENGSDRFFKALRHLGSDPLKWVGATGGLKTTSQRAEELVRARAKSWQSTWTRQPRGQGDARRTGQTLFLKALRHLGSVPLRGSAPKAF